MLSNIDSTVVIQKMITLVVSYIPNLITAVILFILFWISNKIIQKILDTTLSRMNIERQTINLLLRGAKTALYAAGIEIPFPHLQLFVEKTDGIKLLAPSSKTLQTDAFLSKLTLPLRLR